MEKTLIAGFISRYALGNESEAVTWNVKDKLLTTDFKTADKTCKGSVSVKGIDLPDTEIGIIDTEQLSRMLNILDNDIIIDIRKQKGKSISLDVSDNKTSLSYILGQLDIIPKPGKLKMIPTFVCNIDVDTEFSSRFIKSKGALPECNYFTVTRDALDTQVTFGYSDINSNMITYSVQSNATQDLEPIHFSSDKMRDILIANKGIPGQIEISPVGLLRATFKTSDYSAEYYLVNKQLE
tara:strand:- start:1421 stop:2134 length:714 start_codon:yes stop_codon:yes gene_type:complete